MKFDPGFSGKNSGNRLRILCTNHSKSNPYFQKFKMVSGKSRMNSERARTRDMGTRSKFQNPMGIPENWRMKLVHAELYAPTFSLNFQSSKEAILEKFLRQREMTRNLLQHFPTTTDLSPISHVRRKIVARNSWKIETRNPKRFLQILSLPLSLPLRERKQHRSLRSLRAWKPSIQDENRFIVGQFQTRNYPWLRDTRSLYRA